VTDAEYNKLTPRWRNRHTRQVEGLCLIGVLVRIQSGASSGGQHAPLFLVTTVSFLVFRSGDCSSWAQVLFWVWEVLQRLSVQHTQHIQ